ncbi:MAG: hypothetical protein GY942_07825, partial [Aestuariibacter sp.]|nr:hypothetical protein [Aestuariibacter sp.]
MSLISLPGVSAVFSGSDTVLMSVATADVPPESLVYGKTVAINDPIVYNAPVTGDGVGSGTVSVDTLGVPTITGSYGTYPVLFSFDGGAEETKIVSHKNYSTVEALFSLPSQDSEGYSTFTPSATSRLLYVDSDEPNDTTAGPSGSSSDYYVLSTLPTPSDWESPGAVNGYATIAGAEADRRDGEDDWVLIRRGKTYTPAARVNLTKDGKSATERSMFIAWGTGARP